MNNKCILIKVFVLILISITLFGNLYVYADENLEEKFRLLEESKKELEKDFLKTLSPYRGKEYKYARTTFSIQKDENGKHFVSGGGGGSAYLEYNNYIKMLDYIYESANEHFYQYLNRENENEKIKGFLITNYFPYTRENEYTDQKDIEGKVTLFFVPEVKSSKWCEFAEKAYTQIYNKSINDYIQIDGYFTEIYIRLVWEDDKYIIKFIDNKPEGYDEFVARMKEHGIDVENIDYPSLINANADVKQEIQAAEKKEFDTRQTEIRILNNWIIAVCSIMIILIIVINLIINKKKTK